MDRWEIIQAVSESNLRPNERLIMHVLENLTDTKTGEIPEVRQPSLSELAGLTGQGEATVKRALNVLESGDDTLTRGGGWVIRSRASVADQRQNHEITRYQMAYDGMACEPSPTVGAGLTVSPASGRAGPVMSPGMAHCEPSPGLTVSHKSKSFIAVTGLQAAAGVPAAVRIILENLNGSDCTVEEATVIADEIDAKKRPKNLAGLVVKIARDGELATYLDDIRGRDRRAAVAHALAVAKTLPPCEHGNAGGNSLRPDSNEPICANCRHQARQVA